MDSSNVNKSSGRNVQSSLFIKSLRKEMDKMSSSLHKDELVVKASEYFSDGCSAGEVEELLTIDGFNSELVHSCVHEMTIESLDKNIIPWGVDLEDNQGNIISHEDLNIEVLARDEKTARTRAEDLVKEAGGEANFKKIVSVYPLDEV